MHWQLVVINSRDEIARRTMNDGRQLIRFKDGHGRIERFDRRGWEEARPDQLEGYNDWKPNEQKQEAP